MPNLAAVLKTEIARLARRSTSGTIRALKKDVAALKRAMAQQKHLVARLQHDNARLLADLDSRLVAPPMASEDEVKHARLGPGSIHAQRRRLGLSRHAFAKLVGVSGSAVLAWEGGQSKPRAAARAALIAVRKLGKREARERVAVLARRNGTTKPRRTEAPGTEARTRPVTRRRNH